MKKTTLLLAIFTLLGAVCFSQNTNLVIFSEDGDPFYVYVNGVKQNNKAEANVKLTGVSPNVSLRIEFENKSLPQIKQNMALEPGFEHTAKIKRDKQQQLKLRYFGQTPIEESSSQDAAAVAYHTAPDGEQPADPTQTGATANTDGNGAVQIGATSTGNGTGSNEDVTVNISMAGVSMNVNVNATTSAKSSSGSTVTSSSSAREVEDPTRSTAAEPAKAAEPAGCRAPMSASSFETMKKNVEAKPFSDTKMSTAKIATKNNCLSVNQVKEIAKLFSMDEDKLTYAKYAYNYCVDKGNYYQVSEVFAFSGTTEEFNRFLEQ